MQTPIKNLSKGGILYVLVKGENLEWKEATIVFVSSPRSEMPPQQQGQMFPMMNTTVKSVVDITYSVDGKNYTDTISENDVAFQTEKLGRIALIASDRDIILSELRSSLKLSQDHVAKTSWHENRIKQYEKLIAEHDKDFAEKKQQNERIDKIEVTLSDMSKILERISKKLDK